MIGDRRIPAQCPNTVKTSFPPIAGAGARRVVLLGLLLCGCATVGGWHKAATDEATTVQAYRDCEAVAQIAVKPQSAIDQDIIASRGGDWTRAHVFRQQAGIMRASAVKRTRSIIDSCMRAKGFTRG
jgi:hypothetical protein